MNNLHLMIHNTKAVAQNKLHKFKEDFDKDPLKAMHWSLDVFEAAAELRVWEEIEMALKEGADVGDILHDLNHSILVEAQYANYSTSPTANLSEQARKIATAQAYKTLNEYYGKECK